MRGPPNLCVSTPSVLLSQLKVFAHLLKDAGQCFMGLSKIAIFVACFKHGEQHAIDFINALKERGRFETLNSIVEQCDNPTAINPK